MHWLGHWGGPLGLAVVHPSLPRRRQRPPTPCDTPLRHSPLLLGSTSTLAPSPFLFLSLTAQVDSALCTIDFAAERDPLACSSADLRRVLTTAFQQRRKMLRQSLKPILAEAGRVRASGVPAGEAGAAAVGAEAGGALVLPDEWGKRRPEELAPPEFVELTLLIFGPKPERAEGETRVWRHAKHGDW